MPTRIALAWCCLAALTACGRADYSSLDAAIPFDAPATRDAAPDADLGADADAAPSLDAGACVTATYAGHDYALCTAEATWEEARTACTAMGMQLAEIDDAAEQAFVEALAPTRGAWIGATDLRLEGTWEWLDGTVFYVDTGSGGEDIGYVHWGAADPNGGVSDGCAAIVASGFWVDFDCALPSDHLCERP